ncbi:hypothetical protein QAD02_018686 [Eretmocerus hayati]|uniref:Uncharacterized protein n=1 Tax=Eretmocerus hayati TaxID=131215 RepID=A0ACC2PJW7_9HYME|nr:hypothetical protein QAD02_018686 [Eretmocerus hayati]
MAALDLDPQFLQALRLLHSSNRDSVEQLRSLLDDAIRQKYGTSKMLTNTLSKKYMMEETVLSDQSSTSSRKSKSSNSSKHSKHSSKNSSPITIREPTPDPLQSDDNLADILEDVACVICKGMDVGAKNRLVECVKCGSLYHQECHTPAILDSQVDSHQTDWYCANCAKPPPPPKERHSPKPTETKTKETRKSSSSSSKHTDKHKSSSSSNHSSTSNGSSSSSSKNAPNIHIVPSDKRFRDMIKKAKQDKKNRSNTTSTSSHKMSSRSSHDRSNHKNKSD